ncbi:hypothetical protein CsatA_020547 [Cannabis sativa]
MEEETAASSSSSHSRPLAVESFSDSWLSNVIVPSIVKSLEFDESFDFNSPINIIAPSPKFVHADELFSNGLIKSNTTNNSPGDSATVVSTRSSEYNININIDDDDVQMGCSYYFCCCFFRRRRSNKSKSSSSSSTEQIMWLRRVYEYLRPTTRRLVVVGSKVDDVDRRILEVRRWSNFIHQTSPPPTSDTSIHEAILHCKRSIGIY